MSQEELDNFINEEVKGSENAVCKMLMYYISALQTAGVEDVKQYVASRIGDLISLSEEQCQFVMANFYKDNKIVENLKNSMKLLNAMKEKNQLDMESLDIVIKVLNLILKDYEEFKND